MNIFDDMPDIPACPHCGHAGEGLQWAFPDPLGNNMPMVQCTCLACGAHGAQRPSYAEAIEAFAAGITEPSDAPSPTRRQDAGRDDVTTPAVVAATLSNARTS